VGIVSGLTPAVSTDVVTSAISDAEAAIVALPVCAT
jgi:hypothetical protein